MDEQKKPDGVGRVALIGQAPARVMYGDRPFSGRSGKKISELAGVRFEDLGDHFALFNLLPRWPGRQGDKGDAFPMREARQKASEMRTVRRYARVVFVGRKVAEAFRFKGEFCEWGPWENSWAMVMPHPSGVNLWYNDKRNVLRMRRILRRVLREFSPTATSSRG